MTHFRMSVMAALLAGSAWASSGYPGGVQSKLGLSGLPQANCQLCHQSPGGGDTVSRVFGIAMKARGLTGGGNVTALNAALDALEAAGTDSDNDGTGDVAELRAGRNPNVRDAPPVTDGGMGGSDGGMGGTGGTTGVGGTVPMEPPPLRYGCGAEVVPGAIAVGLALSAWARRRRRSRL
jgi:hypothetical protein